MIEAQQLFLAFVSALFGAGLGGAVNWGNARRERRIKLTLELYAQFHAPEFNHIRILAHDALSGASGIPAAYAMLRGDARDAVASVVHFWERVAVLHQSGALDGALLRRFFGQYARWWSDLLCERDATVFDDPEWGQTLRDIRRLFTQLARTQRAGARR